MANNGWGGKRENQTGRPVGTIKEVKKSESIYIKVTPEEKKEIQRLASLEGVPVSQFVLGKIL